MTCFGNSSACLKMTCANAIRHKATLQKPTTHPQAMKR
jgi:hypothetical protein